MCSIFFPSCHYCCGRSFHLIGVRFLLCIWSEEILFSCPLFDFQRLFLPKIDFSIKQTRFDWPLWIRMTKQSRTIINGEAIYGAEILSHRITLFLLIGWFSICKAMPALEAFRSGKKTYGILVMCERFSIEFEFDSLFLQKEIKRIFRFGITKKAIEIVSFFSKISSDSMKLKIKFEKKNPKTMNSIEFTSFWIKRK